ncbi:MAG: NINE protein [Micrococcales bacterium]|nr:NINE protein [Micrococcales bacterium]
MTVPAAPREIPPGWYPDPNGTGSRYWDGAAWTEQVGPALPVMSPMGPAGTGAIVDEWGMPISPRSRLAAAILCGFLGVLGLHRFYTGKIGTGILLLLTGGGLGIWWIVDFILICVGSFRDKQDRRLLNW